MTCCHPPSRRQRRRARFTDNIFLLAVSPPFFPVTVEVLIDLPRHRKPVQHQQRPVTEAIERALFPVTEATSSELFCISKVNPLKNLLQTYEKVSQSYK